jgi:hypothetical protein
MLKTPCTIRHYSGSTVDDYGNPVNTEASTVTTTCWLDPARSFENTSGQETYTQDWTLYLPAGTLIDASDKVEVDGVAYEILGPPRRFTKPPTTVEHHVEVDVRVQT